MSGLVRGSSDAQSVTVANAGTTSSAIQIGGASMVALILPAALTSTTVTFTASDTQAGTFVPVYKSDGTAVSATVAASRAVALPVELFPFNWIKLVTGSAEGAARTIKVLRKG